MAYFVVTPGYTFTANEPVTYAKLNSLGSPVVSFTSELFDLLFAFKNGFINGNLQVWQRGTATLSCTNTSSAATAMAKTWLADRWFVRPVGAPVTCERSTSVPSGALSAYSLLITGASSVSTVEFGQRVESIDAVTNWARVRTFSAYIYNDTGSSFTPKLIVNIPGAADDYTTPSNLRDHALQACPSGAWTQVSYTLASSAGSEGWGLEVLLQIPNGSLNSTAKSVKITQLQCEPGSVVTAQEPRLITHELILCQRYALALRGTSGQVVGFAGDATNLTNKGILTYPTTMRAKPVFNTSNTTTADTVIDYFTATAGSPGTPLISGYAADVIFACANAAANWTVGAQININCVLTAEDRT
jgi:hypothetical protein